MKTKNFSKAFSILMSHHMRLFARARAKTKKRYFRHDCRAVPRPTRSTPRDAHARADPARAHELAKDTAPSEPAPSGRAPRLHPTGTRPIRAWPLGRLPSVSAPRPNANVLFQSTARRWARSRASRRAEPIRARAGSRSRASFRAPSWPRRWNRGEPATAERRQRASDRTCAFSRGSFPRALNDPSEALTAS